MSWYRTNSGGSGGGIAIDGEKYDGDLSLIKHEVYPKDKSYCTYVKNGESSYGTINTYMYDYKNSKHSGSRIIEYNNELYMLAKSCLLYLNKNDNLWVKISISFDPDFLFCFNGKLYCYYLNYFYVYDSDNETFVKIDYYLSTTVRNCIECNDELYIFNNNKSIYKCSDLNEETILTKIYTTSFDFYYTSLSVMNNKIFIYYSYYDDQILYSYDETSRLCELTSIYKDIGYDVFICNIDDKIHIVGSNTPNTYYTYKDNKLTLIKSCTYDIQYFDYICKYNNKILKLGLNEYLIKDNVNSQAGSIKILYELLYFIYMIKEGD